MQNIRIIEIPKCKMVSSGTGMFGQEKFGRFNEWFSSLPRQAYPHDFLFWDDTNKGLHWIYIYEDNMCVPDEFEVIDFTGGLYAVATDIDQKTDENAMNKEVDIFLEHNNFTRDDSRPELGNIITSPSAQEVLGYHQMDYYKPIKKREVY